MRSFGPRYSPSCAHLLPARHLSRLPSPFPLFPCSSPRPLSLFPSSLTCLEYFVCFKRNKEGGERKGGAGLTSSQHGSRGGDRSNSTQSNIAGCSQEVQLVREQQLGVLVHGLADQERNLVRVLARSGHTDGAGPVVVQVRQLDAGPIPKACVRMSATERARHWLRVTGARACACLERERLQVDGLETRRVVHDVVLRRRDRA